MRKLILSCMLFLTLTACQGVLQSDEERAKTVVSDFAQAYFGYDYGRARQFVTPESMRWIAYMGSNVTQDLLDTLNGGDGETAVVEVTDYTSDGDTTATASIRMSRILVADSIGGTGRWVEQADFHIALVKRDGKWLVRMEGPLRSERPSLD